MTDLNKIDKKEVFRVPENYFENLQHEVLSKIHRQKIRSRNNRVLVTIASLAATFLLVFSLFRFTPQSGPDTLVSMSDHETSAEIIPDHVAIESMIPDEAQVIATQPVNRDIALNRVSSDRPSETTSTLAQVIENVELDNLDYQILEFYQEDISLVDLY